MAKVTTGARLIGVRADRHGQLDKCYSLKVLNLQSRMVKTNSFLKAFEVLISSTRRSWIIFDINLVKPSILTALISSKKVEETRRRSWTFSIHRSCAVLLDKESFDVRAINTVPRYTLSFSSHKKKTWTYQVPKR